MFSSLRGFLNRHKRKFLVTGVLLGASAFALSYAQRKVREWQEREARNFVEMAKKKQHFESTERTCNQTILSLAPAVCEAVMKSLDTEEILTQLRGNPQNKVQLWNELKILTFARLSALIYSFTVLVVTLRIQLNVVGGYLYKDSTKGESAPLITAELQQRYLSLCHFFVSEGVDKLSKQILNKVTTVIAPVSLKQLVSLGDLEQLFWSIQAALCTDNSDPIKQMVSYLIDDTNFGSDELFRTMLNETMDLMESEEVKALSISCVSRTFGMLIDQIAEYFSSPTPTNGKLTIVEINDKTKTSNGYTDKSQLNSFVNVNKIELPLVKLIPIINGLISQPIGCNLSGAPDAAVQQLILNDKLKVLGGNIYESFSC